MSQIKKIKKNIILIHFHAKRTFKKHYAQQYQTHQKSISR
jgi:hypothetical protein